MNLNVFKKPILHGRPLCSRAYYSFFKEKIPLVSKPDNLHIVTVNDSYANTNASCYWSGCKIHSIIVPEYIKWITKVKCLHSYISKNFNTLPKYIMYLDGMDTVVINDIPSISRLLKFYECKILFNFEYGYWHTAFEEPKSISGYYELVLSDIKDKYIKLNQKKYKFKNKNIQASLNAGAFVGEKKYLLNFLEKCLDYMEDDPEKGFPYGCPDDQMLMKYCIVADFDNISIDIFHKLFFWGTEQSLSDEINESSPDYFLNLPHSYK